MLGAFLALALAPLCWPQKSVAPVRPSLSAPSARAAVGKAAAARVKAPLARGAAPVLPRPAAAPRRAAPIPDHAGIGAFDDPSLDPSRGGSDALWRLSQDLREEPPETDDMTGQAEWADRLWELKTGEVSPEAGQPPAGQPPAPQPPKEDGGGADYPHNTFTFQGETFRSVVLRPNVPGELELVRMLKKAQKAAYIYQYEYKLTAVQQAVKEARGRGVEVTVLLDFSSVFPRPEPNEEYRPKRSREIFSLLRLAASQGVKVKVLRGFGPYGIMHAKVAVIDPGEKESIASFGSYNWSWTAENTHWENLHFTKDPKRVDALMKIFGWLEAQAKEVTLQSKAEDFTWPNQAEPPPFTLPLDIEYQGIKLPSVMVSPNARPGESIEDRRVQAIDATPRGEELRLAEFAIRSTRIAQALARAVSRGVTVRIISDKGQAESQPFGPYVRWLKAQGADVRVLSGPDPNNRYPLAQKMHHKFEIYGKTLVETGSPNLTKQAAYGNFEVGHFLNDPADVRAYEFAFAYMWSKASPLEATGPAPTLPTDAELSEEMGKPIPPLPPLPTFPAPRLKSRTFTYKGLTVDSVVLRPDKSVRAQNTAIIKAETEMLRIAAYDFNDQAMVDALRELRAERPKVPIQIILDRSHVYVSGLDRDGDPRKPSKQIQDVIAMWKKGEIDLMLVKGKRGGIQHNKIILAGAKTEKSRGLAVFGSYNFTHQSENNHFENMLYSDDPERVADYRRIYEYMWQNGERVDPKRLENVLNRTLETARREAIVEAVLGHSMTDEKIERALALEAQGLALPMAAFQAGKDMDLAAEKAALEAEAAGKKGPEVIPPISQSREVEFNGEKFRLTYFSPNGEIKDVWKRAIKAAKQSLDLFIFSFFSRELAEEVAEFVQKANLINPDLKVNVYLDEGQAKNTRRNGKFDGLTVDEWLRQRKVNAVTMAGPNEDGDPDYEKMHLKMGVFDRKFILTGSYNLSDNAENNNWENVNVIVDPRDIETIVDFVERMALVASGAHRLAAANLLPPAQN